MDDEYFTKGAAAQSALSALAVKEMSFCKQISRNASSEIAPRIRGTILLSHVRIAVLRLDGMS
jgi:hypothetical protein